MLQCKYVLRVYLRVITWAVKGNYKLLTLKVRYKKSCKGVLKKDFFARLYFFTYNKSEVTYISMIAKQSAHLAKPLLL